ncbi:formimidoylglutamase [Muriicola sp. Z0-33]|uniref:formimidoylglutamase n=1 Tax=Muriicola sp. Z0-33 TaxID=2816957 RepID=UPI00223774C5|nr:formimidoylglutamase [Muriicola sp. Z0-33]MCW5517206.1 formimidoylglutamase [Muriicola sp. Z0-33]
MKSYLPPIAKLWTGRNSGHGHYMHERVECIPLDGEFSDLRNNACGILGYCCDEGVRRNYGRPGAAEAPDTIRKQLAKMPSHLPQSTSLIDFGSVECLNGNMEAAQSFLGEKVFTLLNSNIFPIILGGGHDIAYGHHQGIINYLGKAKTLGIINFDAHFDLRSNASGNNSGTPFFQIAEDAIANKTPMNYMCLGIRDNANDRALFAKAKDLEVAFIKAEQFNMHNVDQVKSELKEFIEKVDYLYLTIDMDGFSSAYAPGVSAASPMGFAPDIALEAIKTIIQARKLISMDIAEMNPAYDIDNQTAILAASLIHFVLHEIALL